MEEKVNAIFEIAKRIEKQAKRNENRINDLDNDMAEDRESFQALRLEVGKLVGEMGEFRRAINLMSEKVKNKVDDTLQPTKDAVEELNSTLEKKKRVLVRPIGFFKRIFHEIGVEIRG